MQARGLVSWISCQFMAAGSTWQIQLLLKKSYWWKRRSWYYAIAYEPSWRFLTYSHQGVQFSVGPFKIIDIAEEELLLCWVGFDIIDWVCSTEVANHQGEDQTENSHWGLVRYNTSWRCRFGYPTHEAYVLIVNLHFSVCGSTTIICSESQFIEIIDKYNQISISVQLECDHIFVAEILNFGIHSICFSWLI